MKTKKVAINGFGRIGRAVFRILQTPRFSDIEVVAINDLAPVNALVNLLRYDSTMGKFPEACQQKGDQIVIGERATTVFAEKDPSQLPWKKLGIDTILECTGAFRTRESAGLHIRAGAQRVLLSAPSKDIWDIMVVRGVNDHEISPEAQFISNASCTTNCLAPLVKIIDESFGIDCGNMTTIHAYTNDQNVLDVYHSDPRRARAAAINIIPTSTGAAKALEQVLPSIGDRIKGSAMRVPVANGSLIDLTLNLNKSTHTDELKQLFTRAAEKQLQGIVRCSSEPIVSSDIIGDPHSAIVDLPLLEVSQDRFAHVVAWYDNEWGYSNRLAEVLQKLG